MQVEYANFVERHERIEYAARRFARYLSGKVLDVGCDEAFLKRLRPELDYTGVDVRGAPDVVLDLEAAERLPFPDAAFDTVVCIDVLEHLDALHRTFDEMVRVMRRYLLLALPNCWVDARRRIERGRGAIKHYGLPAERPPDRHKWFFNLSEAADFCRAQEARHALRVVHRHALEKPRPWPLRALRRLRYPARSDYLNRYALSLWVVFEKPA